MKQLVAFAALALLLGACSKNRENLSLDSKKAKSSYAIGQQVGKSLKTQSVDVDVDVIAMSISDALEGESKLTEEELSKAIQQMREDLMAARAKEAEENKKEGAEFLEKNKAKDGVKTTDSGLQYMVEKEGSGKSPSKDSTVKVHYKGTLINGEEFDSSHKRGRPAEFPVTGVIAGWTEALQLMKPGGKWKLFIPPELGYGSRGRPGIPANSVLVFEVELLEVAKTEAKK